MTEPLESSATLEFHGVAYVVTVCVREQTLDVQVEVDGGESCWTAQFPAHYVEDLTRKTGNYKRFPVFVNMLLSAMTHRSDAVFVDLLTTADLELYRKRKMGRPGTRQSPNDSFDSDRSTAAQSASKRFLILTYAVEFDRVHYPLPLNLVDKPTPEILQRTIRRLRQALATRDEPTKDLAEENRALREENRCLKATLKSYCGREPPLESDENAGDAKNGVIDYKRELEMSMREHKELLELFQQLREESNTKIARLEAENKLLKQSREGGDRGRDLDRERADARRRVSESNAAAHEALVQLQDLKNQLDESQLKNKELLRQLAIARAKAGMVNNHNSSSGRPSRGPGGSSRSASNGTPSSSRPLRRTTSRDRYASSEDEDERTNGYQSPAGGAQQRRGFRRFDPTAYQQERERKLQQRSTQRSPSPSQNTARTRRVSGGTYASGYASDSSAGGYSSAGSDGSRTSRGSARSRSRSRVSYQHQREADARLASPRNKPPPPDSPFKSPLPRSNGTANRAPPPRGRTPSPARSANGSAAAKPLSSRRPPTPDASRRVPQRSTTTTATPQKAKPQARKLQRPPALLADTSLDSFSDIDDRLTALQQFLKQAKQGGSAASTTTTAAVIAAE